MTSDEGNARRRQERDRWPLRRNDLPPRRIRDQEPDFNNLDENPVYRSILFGSRTGGIWKRTPPLARGVIIGLLCFIASFFLSALFPVMLILILVIRFRNRGNAEYFRVPPCLMKDLLHAPLEPRDWTIALWAWSTRPAARSAAGVAIVTYLLLLVFLMVPLAFALVGTGSLNSGIFSFLGSLSGCVLGWILMSLLPSATSPLPLLVRNLVRQRKALLSGYPVFRVIARVAVAFVAIYLVFAALGLLLLFGSSYFPGSSLWLESIFELALHPFAPHMGFSLGLIATVVIIRLRRSRFRKRRDAYLNQMDGEVARMLEFLRTDDSASGRARSRGDPIESSGRKPYAAPPPLSNREGRSQGT